MTTPKAQRTQRRLNRETVWERRGNGAGARLCARKAIKLIIACRLVRCPKVSSRRSPTGNDVRRDRDCSRKLVASISDPRRSRICLHGLDNDALSRRMLYDAIKTRPSTAYAARKRGRAQSRADHGIRRSTVTRLSEGLVEAEGASRHTPAARPEK